MFIYLTPYKNDIIFQMRQALVRDYYDVESLYYFFVHLNHLKCKNSKLQSCRSHQYLQFSCKKYLHLTTYKKYIIFLMRQALVRGYYAPKVLYFFLSILTSSNKKTQKYEVVDLIESYNFYINFIFI